MLTIYLAGPIRNGYREDIEWRERVIDSFTNRLVAQRIRLLNPLGGATYNKVTKEWGEASGTYPTDAHIITARGNWSVDQSDLIVFNLLALEDGYPCIGTLLEFGRSTARQCLRYVIAPSGYTGHLSGNQMPGLHPFIRQQAAAVFPSVAKCLEFLHQDLRTLTGENSHAAI